MSKYQATLHDVLKEPKTNNFMRLPERVARTEIGDLCISTVYLGYLANTYANVAGAHHVLGGVPFRRPAPKGAWQLTSRGIEEVSGPIAEETPQATEEESAGAAPFETCVFYPDDTSNVLHRCTTRQEALQYHVRIVQHEINHIVEHLRNLPTQAVTNDSLRI